MTHFVAKSDSLPHHPCERRIRCCYLQAPLNGRNIQHKLALLLYVVSNQLSLVVNNLEGSMYQTKLHLLFLSSRRIFGHLWSGQLILAQGLPQDVRPIVWDHNYSQTLLWIAEDQLLYVGVELAFSFERCRRQAAGKALPTKSHVRFNEELGISWKRITVAPSFNI